MPEDDARACYRAFFEHAPEPLILHADGRIVDGNRAAAEMAGAAHIDELIGRALLDFVEPAYHGLLRRRREQMLRTGERVPAADFTLRRLDGSLFEAEVISTPIQLADRVVIQTAIRDVSERKRIARALRESEARFRLLAENAQDVVYHYRLHPEEALEYVSPSAEVLTGYAPEEFYADPDLLTRILQPEDRAHLGTLFDGEQLFDGPLVFRLIRKDGAERWFEEQVAPVRDAAGKIVAVEGIARDVTERYERELALRESEDKFRTLVESSLAGIYIIQDGRFAYVNPAFAAAFKRTPDEMMGLDSIVEAIYEEDRPLVAENVRRRMENEVDRVVYELRGLRPDGSTVDMKVLGTVTNYRGRRAIIGTALDVTEARRAQADLRESEAFLDSIVEHLPVQIFVKGADDLRFVLLNRAMEDQLGRPRDELMGRTVRQVFPADEAARFTRQDRDVIDRGTPVEVPEEAIHTPHLGLRYLRTKKIPIPGPGGAPRYVLGITEDITEQKEAAERIRASQARYHALSQLLLSFGFSYSVDAAGRRTVEWVTDSIEDVIGFAPSEMKEIDWGKLIHPDDLEKYRDYHARLLENVPAEVELRAARKDGAMRWLRAVSFPEWSEREQRVVKVYGAGQDVTAQKESQLELIRQKERAEEMTRLKDAFLANMSHEIRTPLSAIIGAADILHGEVSEGSHQLVDFVRRGGERLMETLNSVLDLAQLQGGGVRLDCRNVDLAGEVKKTLSIMRPRADKRGLQLALAVDADRPVRARVDEAALGRVLVNLLSNAVKFTERGGITVRVDTAGDRAVIEVEDTGIGISEAFLPHVFTEFRQESTGHTRGYEGNGLGLTITKRLVELMDGDISVRSQRGVGTTFMVRLPRSGAPEMDAAPPAPGAEAAPTGLRVLVVDDDPTIQTIVCRMLGPVNEVAVAGTLQEALTRAAETRYDAFFIDINLRGVATGLDVLQALRRLPAGGEAPIVALTAYALPGDAERFLKAGFDGYTSKPFRREDLLRTLRDVLPVRATHM